MSTIIFTITSIQNTNTEYIEILENITDISLQDSRKPKISRKFHKILLLKHSQVFATLLSINPNSSVFKCDNVSTNMLDVFYDVITGKTIEFQIEPMDIILFYNFCHMYDIGCLQTNILEYINTHHHTFSQYIDLIVDNGDFECAILLGPERNDLTAFTFSNTQTDLSTGVLYCIKNRLITAGLAIIADLSANDLYDMSVTKSKMDNMQFVIDQIDDQLFEPKITWQERDISMRWYAILVLYNFKDWQCDNTEEFKKELKKLPFEVQNTIYVVYSHYSQYMASKFNHHLNLLEGAYD